MPVYDYKCADHGLFYELAAMEDFSKPMACPTCATLCARVIMLAPEFLDMKKENRLAHQRNETAVHAPVLSTPEYRAEQKARREHKHGKVVVAVISRFANPICCLPPKVTKCFHPCVLG